MILLLVKNLVIILSIYLLAIQIALSTDSICTTTSSSNRQNLRLFPQFESYTNWSDFSPSSSSSSESSFSFSSLASSSSIIPTNSLSKEKIISDIIEELLKTQIIFDKCNSINKKNFVQNLAEIKIDSKVYASLSNAEKNQLRTAIKTKANNSLPYAKRTEEDQLLDVKNQNQLLMDICKKEGISVSRLATDVFNFICLKRNLENYPIGKNVSRVKRAMGYYYSAFETKFNLEKWGNKGKEVYLNILSACLDARPVGQRFDENVELDKSKRLKFTYMKVKTGTILPLPCLTTTSVVGVGSYKKVESGFLSADVHGPVAVITYKREVENVGESESNLIRYVRNILKDQKMERRGIVENLTKVVDTKDSTKGDTKGENVVYVQPLHDGTLWRMQMWAENQKEVELPFGIEGDIISGLYNLHATNVLLLDPKPSNVLMDHDGKSYLADFGNSRHYKQEDFSKLTPLDITSSDYISPTFLKECKIEKVIKNELKPVSTEHKEVSSEYKEVGRVPPFGSVENAKYSDIFGIGLILIDLYQLRRGEKGLNANGQINEAQQIIKINRCMASLCSPVELVRDIRFCEGIYDYPSSITIEERLNAIRILNNSLNESYKTLLNRWKIKGPFDEYLAVVEKRNDNLGKKGNKTIKFTKELLLAIMANPNYPAYRLNMPIIKKIWDKFELLENTTPHKRDKVAFNRPSVLVSFKNGIADENSILAFEYD